MRTWRMMGDVRRLLGVLAGLSLALVQPLTAVGCISDQPTFEEAILGAGSVALVEVVDTPTDDSMSGLQTLRVLQVLKGSLPGTLLLDNPRTGLCGDTIGFWAEQTKSSSLLVAFGVRFYQATINPVWGEPAVGDSVFGTAGVPAGATTLDDVVTAARELLPDTAMRSPASAPDLRLVGVALLAVAAVLGGRRYRAIRRCA